VLRATTISASACSMTGLQVKKLMSGDPFEYAVTFAKVVGPTNHLTANLGGQLSGPKPVQAESPLVGTSLHHWLELSCDQYSTADRSASSVSFEQQMILDGLEYTVVMCTVVENGTRKDVSCTI
jgi:hypothetical protein